MAGGTIDLDEIASPEIFDPCQVEDCGAATIIPEIIHVIGTAAPGSSRLDLGERPFDPLPARLAPLIC
jgi:hypothetical protein